jgi:YHS domain-containing protein
MKKLLFIIGCVSLFSCNTSSTEKETKAPVKAETKSTRFANTTDFVCGMDLKDSYTDTVVYQGKTYGFCSPTCAREFQKNPTAFIK